MGDDRFESVVADETELREIYRMPSDLVARKVLGRLDHALRQGLSPQ
jgi:hypothetical protein